MARLARIVVDLSGVRTPQELQVVLRDALEFPGWYGCNWNAFWDSITGLVDMPETLCFDGWSEFECRLPQEAGLMKQCLQEMAVKFPELAAEVVYA